MINYFYLQTHLYKNSWWLCFSSSFCWEAKWYVKQIQLCDWLNLRNNGKHWENKIPKQIAVLLLVIWNRVLPAQVTHWILKVLTCDSDKMDGPLFFLQDLGRIFGSCPTPDSERSLPFWRIFFINILHCSPRNYSQHLRVLSVKLKVCALYCGLSLS